MDCPAISAGWKPVETKKAGLAERITPPGSVTMIPSGEWVMTLFASAMRCMRYWRPLTCAVPINAMTAITRI